MRAILNLLPVAFLFAAAFTAYSAYTAETGLLESIPLTISLISMFVVSLAWRISPAGIAKTISAICFLAVLIIGAYFYFNPATARNIWMILSILILIAVHAALFSLASSSFLFTEARKMVLLLPVLLSFTGLAGLFLWNGSLALCGIGLVAAIIFAMLATLFGLPKKKSRIVEPEDN